MRKLSEKEYLVQYEIAKRKAEFLSLMFSKDPSINDISKNIREDFFKENKSKEITEIIKRIDKGELENLIEILINISNNLGQSTYSDFKVKMDELRLIFTKEEVN